MEASKVIQGQYKFRVYNSVEADISTNSNSTFIAVVFPVMRSYSISPLYISLIRS